MSGSIIFSLGTLVAIIFGTIVSRKLMVKTYGVIVLTAIMVFISSGSFFLAQKIDPFFSKKNKISMTISVSQHSDTGNDVNSNSSYVSHNKIH